ncbi:rhodanese-like domain-containing protein [Aequorivita sp. H23M31]|uniref:Rhodanese-like domain-containing protein n=1 Tax=Aequorivita ciconiae TaxID=2494375 RepID=A0A410G650_9FLAO|nr:rhodanese-like domain-containing protein [Aequorivita sp. H23M31]QAA82774.1 rhodanese-like domain-containing protein [Aequorivita sp. H23M31]
MRYSLLFIFFIFLIGTSSGQESLEKLLNKYNTHSIPYVSVEELMMLQKNDSVVILDAREPEEFSVSHIKSSVNIGFDKFSSNENQLRDINRNAHLIVYCSLGIRSEKIGEKLKKAGFTNVKNLYGGIFEWKNKGCTVIDSAGTETENVHTFSEKWSAWLHAGIPIY